MKPDPQTPGTGVSGVILAAGQSSRMGRNKLLLPVGGISILEHCVRGLGAVCSQTVIVLGARAGLFDDFRRCHPEIEFVLNQNLADGMLSSIRAGLRAVREPRVLILPGDCPFVSEAAYGAVLASGYARAVPVFCGLPGHPVLLDREAIDALNSGDGSVSLRDFLSSHGAQTVFVEDSSILVDIDDEVAYREACEAYDQHHHRAGE